MGKLSEVIDARLLELGIKGSKMCDDLGISRSTLTELRKGRATTLKLERAIAIADYLKMPVEYLIGEQQKEKPDTDSDGFTETERRDIAREVERMMADIENQGDLMFDGNPATPEALQTIRTAFEIGLTNARRLNKEKKSKEG
jgi:hypothetical protein